MAPPQHAQLRSYENLRVLNKLMRLSLSSEPIAGILDKSLGIIMETPWLRILPKGGILLADAATDTLVMTASRNLCPDIQRLCQRIGIGQCLCGKAAQQKQVIHAGCIDHRHSITTAAMQPHGHYNVPILDENSRVLGVLVLYLEHGHQRDEDEVEFLRTVTDTLASVIKRKRAEQWNEHLAHIVADAHNEILILDEDSLRFLQANHAACDNLGYSEAELKRKTPLDLLPQLKASQMAELFRPLRSGQQDHVRLETAYRRKDGSLYDTRITLQRLAFGNLTTIAVIGEDITEAKRAEADLARHREHLEELVASRTEELQQKAAELEEALAREKQLSQRQRQFVSMASHEFRTPLAIIDSTAQRIARKAGQVEGCELKSRTDKIRAAVARMAKLMESTLAAAKSDSGKVTVTLKAGCDLRAVVADCCRRAQEMAPSHRISYDLAGLPASIHGDAAILDQVFTNLLSNAVKYSPRADRILVRGWRQEEDAMVSVQDFGLGIDAEDLPHMFERFFRARTSAGIAGTGIGLNLVKLFIEEHCGTIGIDSRKGEGSTFTVRLPAMARDGCDCGCISAGDSTAGEQWNMAAAGQWL
jgi:PAS domain S-box-containing protein